MLLDGSASHAWHGPAAAQDAGHRGHLPGADPLPRSLGRREHLHGPPAAAGRPAHRPAARCTPTPPSCSRGSASASTRAGSPAACRSPTSRSSRSPRRCRSTPRVIIMDEPTAALSGNEVERLFDVVARAARRRARAVLFISHRLDEVFEHLPAGHRHARRPARADQRAGRRADRRRPGPRDGRPRWRRDLYPKRGATPATSCSTVERLTREGVFTDVSFRCGPARSSPWPAWSAPAAARSRGPIFGVDRYDAGRVAVRGRALRRGLTDRRHGRRHRLRARGPAPAGPGHGHVGRSKHRAGVLRPAAHGGLVRSAAERAFAADWAGPARSSSTAALDRHRRPRCPAATSRRSSSPSGWRRSPTLLIVDEPTRGIDVGTKAEVHRLLVRAGRPGIAILMISSELPEVLRHGRPRPGHARGAAHRRARRHDATPPRRRSWPRPPAS